MSQVNKYDIAEHFEKTDAMNNSVHVITLVSNVIGIGSTYESAYLQAKSIEEYGFQETLQKHKDIKSINVRRDETGSYLTYEFDIAGYKPIKVKSTGNPGFREAEIMKAYNLAKSTFEKAQAEETSERTKALDAFFKHYSKGKAEQSTSCGNPDCKCGHAKANGDYGPVMRSYVKRLPGVKGFATTEDGNVLCYLESGVIGKSVRHPKDKFDIDLGCLWSYINAQNSPIGFSIGGQDYVFSK